MRYLLTFLFCFNLPLLALDKAVSSKPIMVHYMPWYVSKSVSGQWGWHWTMDHFKPDNLGSKGKRELASHYRPLIGAYDSNDPDLLECQVLLMKFAGINGVIIDWYGTENFRDYATIHRNSLSLIKYIKKAGLNFAICYEDQSVKHMINGGKIKKAQELAYAKKAFQWMEQNFFADPAYMKIKEKPILLIFGPQHFKKYQWAHILSGLSNKPQLFTLPHLKDQINDAGTFGWPPVHGGKNISPKVWQQYLQSLYTKDEQNESTIASVFPQFHDIYQQAGVHKSYGYLGSQKGKTFDQTLEAALKSNSELIQIATWNDYGEGTMIEPTKEFTYRYLERIQRLFLNDNNFSYIPSDLRLPVNLYQLRKHYEGNKEITAQLNRASKLLFEFKAQEATKILLKYIPALTQK
ncbi:MAG: glycoside hydrolase family 71/99-like protein [Verrucomicrobiales bacterium]|nr:glycoside hydrolase family 71/99-like protein [Verrucomicrobiales bacterium]